MKNMYFEGNKTNGIDLINELEDYCINWQRKRFCRINELPVSFAKYPWHLVDKGFTLRDVNPRCCEVERKNRVYYSWQGSVHYTQNKFKKFIVRMLFKRMEYKED